MGAGFLYILANSSMPDVVKVGKTSKSPSGRAQELSGATGVPTPFLVVYEQAVRDCDRAEQFVHALLSQKGYRVAGNREFFKAPIPDVVSAFLALPRECVDSFGAAPDDDELLSRNSAQVELESLVLEEPATFNEPWRDLWERAESANFGLGEELEDPVEAARLYGEAAKLGCSWAYWRLGDIHAYGNGTREDIPRAIEYFKEGARRGNYGCFLRMAALFFCSDRSTQNARKRLELFFRDREAKFSTELETSLGVSGQIGIEIAAYVELFQGLSASALSHLRDRKDEILSSVDRYTERLLQNLEIDEVSRRQLLQTALLGRKWLSSL